MQINKTKNYTTICASESNFYEFHSNFIENQEQFLNQNLIIQFSENLNITVQQISLFLDASNSHKNSGTSFVVICTGINIDEFPEGFNIVPTLTEAIDIIEMEDIERDLGF